MKSFLNKIEEYFNFQETYLFRLKNVPITSLNEILSSYKVFRMKSYKISKFERI